MAKHTHKKESRSKTLPIISIVSGVILFSVRYVPLLPYNAGPISAEYSLSKTNSICEWTFTQMANKCLWIKPLNLGLLVLSLTLMGLGTYYFFKKK